MTNNMIAFKCNSIDELIDLLYETINSNDDILYSKTQLLDNAFTRALTRDFIRADEDFSETFLVVPHEDAMPILEFKEELAKLKKNSSIIIQTACRLLIKQSIIEQVHITTQDNTAIKKEA